MKYKNFLIGMFDQCETIWFVFRKRSNKPPSGRISFQTFQTGTSKW